jgi:hypothetical protein
MNRRYALAIAGAVAVAAALWLFTASKSDVPAAEGSLEAEASGPSEASSSAVSGAPMRPPQVAMADDPEGTLLLEGQVIDADDIPIGGAEITIDSNPPRQVLTEADGSFAIDKLIGRAYVVTAVFEDEVGGPVRHELTESSEPVIVRLRPAASMIVTVSDEGGAPVRGASVHVRGSVNRSGETDADGRAHVRGVSPGFALVSASAPGYGPTREPVQVPDRPGAEVRVSLIVQAGAPISGRVTTFEGEPVAGARVVAEDASAMFSLVDPDHEGVLTASDGRYEIPAVSAGNVRVVARHERHPTGSSELIATDGRRPITGVDIRLAPAASVAGRVLDTRGQPVAWAAVRVAPAYDAAMRSGAVRGATADDDGRFEVVGLEREPAHILATSERMASSILSLSLDERHRIEGVELVLDAPARIAGRVVDGDGEPVPEVHVIAYPDVLEDGVDGIALRGGGQATTDGGGRFELTGLAEGRYRLQAQRTSGWQMRGQPGAQARTGDEDVELRLEREGGIKGRVALDEGGYPGAFSVAVGLAPGTPFASQDGAFELDGIEPGTHTLVIRGPTFASRTVREVAVEPGVTTDLGTVTVTRGRGVSGHVYDARGAAVAGATVVMGSQLFGDGKSLAGGLGAFAEQMGIRITETDDRGFYELAGIPASRQTIAAEHPDRGRSLAASVPAAQGSLTVDLELVPFGSVRGRATVGGEPRRGVSILATGKTDAEQNVMVTTAGDGSFVIERIAAGEHRITAMLGGMMGGQMEGRDVTVPPGEEAFVEIDLEVGDLEVVVAVRTDDGTPLAAAQVFLVEGVIRAETGEDVNRLFREGDGSMTSGFMMGDRPATFRQMLPGRYSVCAIPIAGSLEDPEVIRNLQERAGELPVHCQVRDVRPTPSSQSIEVKVPAPPPLGEGGEARGPNEVAPA